MRAAAAVFKWVSHDFPFRGCADGFLTCRWEGARVNWAAMQFTVILVFALVLTLGEGEAVRLAHAGGGTLAAGLAAYLLLSGVLAWAISQAGLRRLRRGDQPFSMAVQGHQRWQLLLRIWLAAGMALLLMIGLTDRLRVLPGMNTLPLVREVAALSVFLAALLVTWRISYSYDQAVRWQVEQDLMQAGQPVRPGWSARQYVDFHFRHDFLFVALPVGLIMLARDLLDLAIPLIVPPPWREWATPVLMAAAVGAVFFFSPLLLVHVWRTRPMPDGELRRRLERLCERIGLRYRRICVWDTSGVVVNAGVMGLHRSVRYIMITDALLENMEDRQIVAVFGHEAGHVRHHHTGYFLVYTVGAMQLCLTAVAVLGRLLPAPAAYQDAVEMLATLTTVALVWGLGFGWLSRRMERQADVYGAWCAGVEAETGGSPPAYGSYLAMGAGAFVAALENVARLNGMSPSGRNWRHGSIDSRVSFLLDWVGGGYSREDFDRLQARLKLLLWALLAAGLASTALTWRMWA
jgi:STE24 endopeptidase